MNTSFKYCQKCGTKLAFETLVCPRCGTAAPDTFFFSPPPEAPAPASSGRGARFWIGLSALIGGSMCICLALAAIAYTALGGSQLFQRSAPAATAPLVETLPTQTIPPTAEALPVVEATPTPKPMDTSTPEVTATGVAAQSFFDDFSNNNSGWMRVTDPTYTMEYLENETYGISLGIANKMALAMPPYPFSNPGDLIIKVRLKGDGGNGFYGVMCHREDPDNYYRVSFSGDQYAIDKIIDGAAVELTQPYWKKIILYQPAADGMISVVLACVEGRIQMLVDDVGQEIVSDSDLSGGEAAIFVAAGDIKNENGIYMEAFFDDFSAELP